MPAVSQRRRGWAVAAIGALLIAGLATWWLRSLGAPAVPVAVGTARVEVPPAAAIALAPPAARAPASVAPAHASADHYERVADYFHRELEGNEAVKHIYRSLVARLPAGRDSDLLAIYAAEGIARRGTPEFARFMTELHATLDDRASQLAHLIADEQAALKREPFTYLMTLNLAARLDLPPERKAGLLGDAMQIPFELDASHGPTRMSANITNAFILMKNRGITATQAAPYIQRGVEVNRGNPAALAEFVARANTYYPGSVR